MTANKEVILSAGAVGSPHLLMLSGVGPQEQLSQFNIHTFQHLPAVGQNLHDHYGIAYRYSVNAPVTIDASVFEKFSEILKAGIEYYMNGSGTQMSIYCDKNILNKIYWL